MSITTKTNSDLINLSALVELAKRLNNELKSMSYSLLQKTEIGNHQLTKLKVEISSNEFF